MSPGYRSACSPQLKLPGVDHDAADRGAVAAEELRGRVDDDVGAVLDRPQQVGRRHGVVDHERHAGLVRDVGDRRGRRARCRAGCPASRRTAAWCSAGSRRATRRALSGSSTKLTSMPELRERVVEQVVGAAVERGARHEVVARLGDVEDREGLGGLAGGERHGGEPAFERRDALFQHVLGGVHDPRVDVAQLGEPEQRGGVLGVAERVGRGLVDRGGTSAGGRVGRGARVHLLGLEGPGFGHSCLQERATGSSVSGRGDRPRSRPACDPHACAPRDGSRARP